MTIIEQIEQRKKFLSKGILNSLSNQEVITPISLVEEMLDKLPEDIWKNPDLTWADPCSKSGSFPLEIIYRLMKNLPIESETLRYEHIINNMVSVYVNADRNKWVVAKAVYGDVSEVGKLKLLEIDKLKENDMPKFDVVVGNPPYQNSNVDTDAAKLYLDITKISLKILSENGILSFLTPSTIARDGRNKFSLRGIPGLKYIDYTADKYFKQGVYIISWMIDKSYDGEILIKNKNEKITSRKIGESLADIEILIGLQLFEKIKTNKTKLFISDQTVNGKNNPEQDDVFRYPYHLNYFKGKIAYSNIKPKLYQSEKLVISISKRYSKDTLIRSNEDFGQLHLMINIEDYSETQINNIIDFLFHDICVSLVNKYRIIYETGFNNILYVFPEIDVNKHYNEKDIIELFKLTKEEVNYLKS